MNTVLHKGSNQVCNNLVLSLHVVDLDNFTLPYWLKSGKTFAEKGA